MILLTFLQAGAMEKVAEFLENAISCALAAEKATSEARRAELDQLALQWMKLAEARLEFLRPRDNRSDH